MNADQRLMLVCEQAVANSLSVTHNKLDKAATALAKLNQLVVGLKKEIKPNYSQEQDLPVQSVATTSTKDDGYKAPRAELVDSDPLCKYEQAVYQETPKLPPRTTIAQLKEIKSACDQVTGDPQVLSQDENQPTFQDLIGRLVEAISKNNADSQARGADIHGSESKTEQESAQQVSKSSSEPPEKEVEAARGQGLPVQFLATVSAKDIDSQGRGSADLLDSRVSHSNNEQEPSKHVPNLSSKLPASESKEIEAACGQGQGLSEQYMVSAKSGGLHADESQLCGLRGTQCKTQGDNTQHPTKLDVDDQTKSSSQGLFKKSMSTPLTKDVDSKACGAHLLTSHDSKAAQDTSHQILTVPSHAVQNDVNRMRQNASNKVRHSSYSGQNSSNRNGNISYGGQNAFNIVGHSFYDAMQQPLSSAFRNETQSSAGTQWPRLSQRQLATASSERSHPWPNFRPFPPASRTAQLFLAPPVEEHRICRHIDTNQPPDEPTFITTDHISPLRKFRPLYGPLARPAYSNPEPPPAASPVVEETQDPRFDRPFQPIMLVTPEDCLRPANVSERVFYPPPRPAPESPRRYTREEMAASIIRKPRKKPPPRIYSFSSDDEDDGW